MVLVTYFFLGILLTGEVAPSVVALLLVLVVWFSVYKFKHKGLGNRVVVTKMYVDLKGILGEIVEKQRMAEEAAQVRAAARRERLAHIRRERRTIPTPDSSAAKKYADMIENKVRQGKAGTNESVGQHLSDGAE